MIVASSVLLSGVGALGVSVIVSVVNWPIGSVTEVNGLAASPDGKVVASETVSGTLPALVSVIVSTTEVPGVVLTDEGSLVMVTASILGTVNVTVCVLVIEESVVLVAVTVNESCVPGGGIVWPVFGCR